MPRRKLYRAAKGAFAYLRRCLGLLVMSIPWMILVKPVAFRVLPAFFAAGAVVALWSKRDVIRDLWEGRTETARGRIGRREIGDSLKYLRVDYLWLDTETLPQRLVLFSSPFGGGIPGLLDSPLILHYLPRSGVVVQVEVLEKPDTPRHRSRQWHEERQRREEEQQRVMRLEPCRLRESYWFWEDLFLTAPIVLFLVWGIISTVCDIAGR